MRRTFHSAAATTRGARSGRALALGIAAATFCLIAAHPTHAASPSGTIAFIAPDGAVATVAVAGGAVHELWTPSGNGNASEPQWSRDGSAIAFIGPDGNVWTVGVHGGDAHAVTQQAAPPSGCGVDECQSQGTRADSPRWSPDSHTISYRLVDDAAKVAIYTVAAAGGTPHQIGSADGLCLFNEGFTPAGAPLFSRCAPAGGDSNETYEAAVQPPAGLLGGSQLSYSAAGNRVAYARQTQSGASVNVALYTAAADGSGATLIANGGQDPAWSANGLLAYEVSTPDGRHIHVYDAASGTDTTIVLGMLAGWSADGSALIYSSIDDNGDAHIMRIAATGGASTAVAIASGAMPAVSTN